ncbi:hypothetical protein PF004_g28877 [Phytophthora fragariae]|uniref:Integrase catalytic domain-containing protein n=1 Tax=Phytophthora fragariae TaxID=53985 RepID=A0A6G0MGD3_9STRA|nr:hypothetical protein PF004_g28877 [Phytophthora fragariae]
MTTRHDASREVDSSSENDELEEVLSRLDALIIDAGLVGDSCEDEGLVTSEEEEVREESDSHAHIGWWYDGQDHDEGEVNTSSGRWYFDTAANVHVTGNPWYYVTFTPDPSQSQHIQSVTAALASRIAGVGTVALITMVDGQQATVTLNDVFYVPGATHGLFSIGLAAEQGFDFDYDRQTEDFRVQDQGRTVIVASPHEATWGFQVTHPSNGDYVGPQDQPLSNFTAAEGVASLKLWHERLGHTCPQYLKMMVGKGLVRGMLMKQRDLGACDACHIGKQKKKPHLKKLERNTKTPNQVVYADLLILSKDNGTRFEAVLVIMDGFSRFVTLHMLTSKSSEVVNRHIKEYVLWAERQAGRHKVRQVLTRTLHVVYKDYPILTDKSGEFVNTEMESWYKAEHVLVGPKSSQLNLCERTHQSLVEMMKASMHDAGFPKTLWLEALRNAVYIKNRIYNKGTGGVSYEMLFGVKPDLHHVRKFGALAYVHVPVTPGRKKHQNNARLGFVLGYAEDVIGCKVYFPDNRTAKFVSDLRVAEDVMYRDRHEVTVKNDDLESLHFVQSSEIVEDDDADSTHGESTMECEAEGNTAAAPTMNEITAGPTVALEGGETCGAPSAAPSGEAVGDLSVLPSPSAAPNAAPSGETVGYLSVLSSGSGHSRTDLREAYRATPASSLADVGGVTAALPSEPAEIRSMQTEMQCELDELQSESQSELLTESQDDRQREREQHSSVSPGTMASPSEGDVAATSDAASCDNSESVAGQCGSDVGDTEELADGNAVAVGDELEDEEATTVASVCGPLTGKRQRDETPSEEIRVEQSAERQEPKRTRRTGLHEYHERRRPAYLRDYVMNVAQNTSLGVST